MWGDTVLDLSAASKLLWEVSEPICFPPMVRGHFISPVSFPKTDTFGVYIFGHLSIGSLLYF